MTEIVTLLLFLLVGIATGFVDSALGSGGLISIPSLIFLGVPPPVAIATDRFGTLGRQPVAFYTFWKAKKIVWKYVPVFSVISLIGSLIGAGILVSVDPTVLQKMIAVIIFVLLPFIIIKTDLGVQHIKKTIGKTILGLTFYFLIDIFGSFLGQGTGILIFYTLTFFLGFTMIEILATNVIPGFIFSLSSLIVFAAHGLINYKIGLILFIGMALGGYLGAKMVIEKGEQWVKKVFVLFVIIAGIKLLFFSK